MCTNPGIFLFSDVNNYQNFFSGCKYVIIRNLNIALKITSLIMVLTGVLMAIEIILVLLVHRKTVKRFKDDQYINLSNDSLDRFFERETNVSEIIKKY